MSEKEISGTDIVVKPGSEETGGSSRGFSAVAWLALLLVLCLAGGIAWGVRELQGKEVQIDQRFAELESSMNRSAVKESDLANLSSQWEKRLAGANAKGAQIFAKQTQQLKVIESRLAAQREELSLFGASDKQDWLLAEAQYLLRLANQRLIMADDLVAAKALLTSADSILAELEDVGLHGVRAAVAADLAAVRAVPKRDVQGMYLSLAALIEQADKLVIFKMPEVGAKPAVEPAEDWQGRLQQGYEAALSKLSNYIVIKRRDVPMDVLMDPQWEGLVRQNLRMLLEQAQVALLSANQTLFRESLERAGHWIAEFFQTDEAAARALAQELTTLGERNISVEMPDISRSLTALDAALEQRSQRGGAE